MVCDESTNPTAIYEIKLKVLIVKFKVYFLIDN